MVESNVLKFGDFTLKSGRKSPFFMNAGAYVTGTQLKKLGEYYAKAIHDNFGLDFDVLFGPAYKGIPLSVATTMAISDLYGKDIRYCSNRKEVKDHGDTGILLGSKLKDGDRVVIIEDVTTSGKSIEETALTPEHLTSLIEQVEKGVISNASAKKVFAVIVEEDKDPLAIIEEKGMKQNSDTGFLEQLAKDVLAQNEKSVTDYKHGKTNALGYLVGQCMKASKGKANPGIVKEIVTQMLNA